MEDVEIDGVGSDTCQWKCFEIEHEHTCHMYSSTMWQWMVRWSSMANDSCAFFFLVVFLLSDVNVFQHSENKSRPHTTRKRVLIVQWSQNEWCRHLETLATHHIDRDALVSLHLCRNGNERMRRFTIHWAFCLAEYIILAGLETQRPFYSFSLVFLLYLC